METNLAMFLGRRCIPSSKTTWSYGKKLVYNINSDILIWKRIFFNVLGGTKKRYINSVSLIDRSARIGFPLSFGILILLYWLIYVTYQDDFPMIKQQGRIWNHQTVFWKLKSIPITKYQNPNSFVCSNKNFFIHNLFIIYLNFV